MMQLCKRIYFTDLLLTFFDLYRAVISTSGFSYHVLTQKKNIGKISAIGNLEKKERLEITSQKIKRKMKKEKKLKSKQRNSTIFSKNTTIC